VIGNRIEKAILFGLSLVAIIEGCRLVFFHSATFGSGQAGGYLILLGLVIGFLSLYAWRRGNLGSRAPADVPPEKGKTRSVVLCLLILAGTALLIPWLGYMLSTVLFFLAYFRVLGGYRWLRALLLSAMLGVFFAYVFTEAGMMLPQGFIPWP
jgi:hypothetical protein